MDSSDDVNVSYLLEMVAFQYAEKKLKVPLVEYIASDISKL